MADEKDKFTSQQLKCDAPCWLPVLCLTPPPRTAPHTAVALTETKITGLLYITSNMLGTSNNYQNVFIYGLH